MQFDPKMADEGLLKAGWYETWTEGAEETVSKAGNAMIVIPFKVANGTGLHTEIREYFSENSVGLRRLREFCKAVAIDFDSGEIKADQCDGKKLFIEIAVKPSEGDFPPKNIVKKFRPLSDNPPALQQFSPDVDDGIPF